MMVRAPGKLVLSGAYAVLEGAPAVVTAVDRCVVADASRPADFVTPEVKAALGEDAAPWFDASDLRQDGKKIGLGSSAAIVVASLAAVKAKDAALADDELRDAVFDRALAAHREAQGGGSGIDVAASAHGGTIVATRNEASLEVRPVRMPMDLHVEVWMSGTPASTSDLVGRVQAFADDDPETYTSLMNELVAGAQAAISAIDDDVATAFIGALRLQRARLATLGESAHVPIVTDAVARLAEEASREGAAVLPSGAGGGDVALFVGSDEPSARMIALREREQHSVLDTRIHSRGVHCVARH